MGSLMVGNTGLPVLDTGPAAVSSTANLAAPDGVFGDQGTVGPVRSALNPGAPNINPSNALPAIAALLFGFTPTHAVVPAAPVSAPQPLSAQTQKLDAIFSVGTAAENPSVNLLA